MPTAPAAGPSWKGGARRLRTAPPRRGRQGPRGPSFTDIDEINSTLRDTGDRSEADATDIDTLDALAAPAAGGADRVLFGAGDRGGARRASTPTPAGSRRPFRAFGPALGGYVETVNGARYWLDDLAQGLASDTPEGLRRTRLTQNWSATCASSRARISVGRSCSAERRRNSSSNSRDRRNASSRSAIASSDRRSRNCPAGLPPQRVLKLAIGRGCCLSAIALARAARRTGPGQGRGQGRSPLAQRLQRHRIARRARPQDTPLSSMSIGLIHSRRAASSRTLAGRLVPGLGARSGQGGPAAPPSIRTQPRPGFGERHALAGPAAFAASPSREHWLVHIARLIGLAVRTNRSALPDR